MGTSYQINKLLKLNPNQGYPTSLKVGNVYMANIDGYETYLLDIPIPLINKEFMVCGDVIIFKLSWEGTSTQVVYEIVKVYEKPIPYKH